MSIAPPVISCHEISHTFLETPVLLGVNLTVHEGDRMALLGANGSGKSTLMQVLAGSVVPQGGEVRFRRGTTTTFLPQGEHLNDEETVREALEGAFERVNALEAELDEVHHALGESPSDSEMSRLLERQVELTHELERLDVHTKEARISEAMNALGVPAPERRIGELSGGERRRTALCRTLLENPDLLLLDEPTNHLDAETIDWLEGFLAQYTGTVVLVTHDRYFLDRVATRMVELFRGEAKTYEGNYSDYLEQKEVEAQLYEREETTRRILMRREMDWLRRQPKARTTKAKARIGRAEDLMKKPPPPYDPSVEFFLPEGRRLGNVVVELEDVCFSIAGRKLIDNFTFYLGKGERVGVVGRNGLGKTSLLRLILGEAAPDSGRRTVGPSVDFLYADQQRRGLDPDKTVLQEIAGESDWVFVGGQKIGVRSWCKRFLFDDSQAAMPIRLLSGGERNRVQIAKMLRQGGNVIVLDEPTNDLDIDTLQVLENGMVNYNGAALIVSHDRYFLNKVANRIIAFRGEGQVAVVEGNYDDYRRYVERVEEAESREKEEKPAEKAATPPRREKSRTAKLSYNEQREFEGMEERILEAEERLEDLAAKVENPQTFVELGGEEIKELLADHKSAKEEVDRLYARWAELSERAR